MQRTRTNNGQHQRPIPEAPGSIAKGSTLRDLLGQDAIECLAHNLHLVHRSLDVAAFRRDALNGLEPLGIMQRGQHLASVIQKHLPQRYEKAIDLLIASLGPPHLGTAELGLAVFFYLPHVSFVGSFGWDSNYNAGHDPFEASMRAQRELTKRFTAEFSMRPFLIRFPERTLERLLQWTTDPDPNVRRLCSEGSRPRLPWAQRIPSLIRNPRPVFPILEALKDDGALYVRRSVANHIGDIAKDHPTLAFELCDRWLDEAAPERKWIIRHALRHPAKKGVKAALNLRRKARL